MFPIIHMCIHGKPPYRLAYSLVISVSTWETLNATHNLVTTNTASLWETILQNVWETATMSGKLSIMGNFSIPLMGQWEMPNGKLKP